MRQMGLRNWFRFANRAASAGAQKRRGASLAATRPARYAEQLEARQLLANDPIVTVNTNFGNFQIELFPSVAPQTVSNFLTYVNDGAYNDAIFHRSVPGFVEQTGGYLSASNTFSGNASQFTPITTNPPIPLEYNLPNTLGTVAMARGTGVNSATSQWFVNLADNTQQLGPSNGGGYAVFGQVIGNGMSTFNQIATLPVHNIDNGALSQVPVSGTNQLVRILSIGVDSIDGTVFSDINANGTLDTGESGIAGRTVFLDRDGNGVPDANNPSTTTDANGSYTFSGLAAGGYLVKEVIPANGSLTTSAQLATVSVDQTAAVNLGERPSIVGKVFTDANSNGQLDTGELGVAGRTVFLDIDGSGAPGGNNPSTTTAADGTYAFSSLAPGSYTVREVLPSGTTATTASAPATVVAGQTDFNVNLGETPPPLTTNQIFVNQVYHDLLNRPAEPLALSYWSGLMASGQSRPLIVLQIEGSQEFRNDTVDRLFQLYLHRSADSAGLAGGSQFLALGGTPEQLGIALVSSSEYYTVRGGGTTQGFLDALYGDTLHRPVDAATLALLAGDDFSQQLERAQAASVVFGGNEYLSDLVNYSAAPLGWYEAYLGRPAEPAAVTNVVAMLHSGSPDYFAVAQIIGSDEYFARAQSEAT
jgi:cyclophilin family peptidyl-prolyl cis-trans isomerase